MGLVQAGIPHKYPAKPKIAASAAKAELEKAPGGKTETEGTNPEGTDPAAVGQDAAKSTPVSASGVSNSRGS